ncbi:MAG: hypothetical protein JSR37_01600 [Verrucomicrobia bacterium]|nr:hypothetical protein [Verrucomicrobiota bacterium]MBS0638100.1 hypothetical protein [Verrucomicrobiota bacterium]
MAQRVYMTEKELFRAEIFSKVKDKRLNQCQAAEKVESFAQGQFLRKSHSLKKPLNQHPRPDPVLENLTI